MQQALEDICSMSLDSCYYRPDPSLCPDGEIASGRYISLELLCQQILQQNLFARLQLQQLQCEAHERRGCLPVRYASDCLKLYCSVDERFLCMSVKRISERITIVCLFDCFPHCLIEDHAAGLSLLGCQMLYTHVRSLRCDRIRHGVHKGALPRIVTLP